MVDNVHTLLSRREHSIIVEGQRLGTVHIMEGTCCRLRFSVRNEQKRDTDMYMNTNMYIFTYKNMYVCVCVCLFFFFVVWCRVMS